MNGNSELSDTCAEVYLRLRGVMEGQTPRSRPRKRITSDDSVAFQNGRDPNTVGNVLDSLATDLGWGSVLAESEVMNSWPAIVGEKTASFSTPESFQDGVLQISCQSTAWATQLRLMRNEILLKIHNEYPAAQIVSVHFKGPNAPSWKKGPKSVSGRGPRDTYG